MTRWKRQKKIKSECMSVVTMGGRGGGVSMSVRVDGGVPTVEIMTDFTLRRCICDWTREKER